MWNHTIATQRNKAQLRNFHLQAKIFRSHVYRPLFMYINLPFTIRLIHLHGCSSAPPLQIIAPRSKLAFLLEIPRLQTMTFMNQWSFTQIFCNFFDTSLLGFSLMDAIRTDVWAKPPRPLSSAHRCDAMHRWCPASPLPPWQGMPWMLVDRGVPGFFMCFYHGQNMIKPAIRPQMFIKFQGPAPFLMFLTDRSLSKEFLTQLPPKIHRATSPIPSGAEESARRVHREFVHIKVEPTKIRWSDMGWYGSTDGSLYLCIFVSIYLSIYLSTYLRIPEALKIHSWPGTTWTCAWKSVAAV